MILDDSQMAWDALKDDSVPSFSRETLEDAISRGGSLWTRVGPEDSRQRLAFTGTYPVSCVSLLIRLAVRNTPKPVYFRMLSEDPGSCIHMIPSEPAKEDPDHKGVFVFRTRDEATPFLGNLREVIKDGKTAEFRLHFDTPEGSEYMGTAVATHNPSRCAREYVKVKRERNQTVKQKIWKPQVTATSADTAQ